MTNDPMKNYDPRTTPHEVRNLRPEDQVYAKEHPASKCFVLGDLHRPDGSFYRVARVAQCQNYYDALRYCKDHNKEEGK